VGVTISCSAWMERKLPFFFCLANNTLAGASQSR
jgi:hypothetical protein